MAEIKYVGKNEDPDDARFKAAKAREREAIAALREDELARKRGQSLDLHEVRHVIETMVIVFRQETMRVPAQALIDLRSFNFAHDVLHALKMSLDKSFRAALGNFEGTLREKRCATLTRPIWK